MFLIKVALKYSDLIEPDKVYNMTMGLVRHFRSLSAGKWHLANLMTSGLEQMAATLKTDKNSHGINGNGMISTALLEMNGIGGDLTHDAGMDASGMGMNGEMFFDYGMSFGLSPVFRFDSTLLGGLDGHTPQQQVQGFGDVDYHSMSHHS